METKSSPKTGRGAQIDPSNRFAQFRYETRGDYLEFLRQNEEDTSLEKKTKFIEVFPKTIVNKVTSPDVGLGWSANPYQGCEHGCAYCYARNSHEYWGYSAGAEFEQNILIKKNAADLLEQNFQKKSWQPAPIMLSGNTDCYQPAEKKFGITRKMLEVFWNYKNPVGIITKNALVLRDLDILKKLAAKNLVVVNLSITSLDETVRRKLEPRTATARRRLQTVATLSENKIPVNVMIAPVIPGLTSHEILPIAKAVSEAGALSIGYTMVRLNGQIADIFMDWARYHYPDRAEKIMHLIQSAHDGNLNDSQWGRRMMGDGRIAEQVRDMVNLARRKYFKNRSLPPFNYDDFVRAPKGQLGLF